MASFVIGRSPTKRIGGGTTDWNWDRDHAESALSVVMIATLMTDYVATMSKGHGRIERLILEALKSGRGNANKGMFAMGTSAEMLACYVRVGKVYLSAADALPLQGRTPATDAIRAGVGAPRAPQSAQARACRSTDQIPSCHLHDPRQASPQRIAPMM
jgi:hypothetical protein